MDSSKGNAFSSIRGRLVSLLLLVLVPILLAQAYFDYVRHQSKKRVESEANLHLARATAKSFDTFLQDVLHQELAIGLAFTSSQTLSDKEKSRLLLENQAGNPAVWHFFWDNPAGIVTAATGSQFIGMNISDREFYREIVAGKAWVVSDMLLSKTTQQPSFTISRGIRNERGELLGIIVAGILPAKLDRVLAVERPGDAGVSLLDSKGMNAYRFPATKYTWEQRNWLKHYPIIGEVLKGKEVVTSVASDLTGINRIVAFTPVPSIGWIAASSRAEEEAARPIISATLQDTWLTLLVAFVSLLTAVALSRTISTFVIILRNYALSLGRGEALNRLTISRPAEIRDLAEALNKMAEEIRSREKALRESEQRYSALFANKINGMVHCRIITNELGHPVDYLVLQVNEAYERIIGIKKADIEGLRITAVFPDIREYALDYIGMYGKVALESGEIRFEDYFEATGQWLSIYAYSPLPGEFIALFTDVSERKQAEQVLKESEEQFRALANSIPNLAWRANSDGYITWYNRRWYEYTGTTPEQMEGWGWQGVHDPDELPKVLERWQASIATGEPFDMTFPLRGADGVFRLFLTRVIPLQDAAGRVQQWFGTNTDVSKLKRVEEALRESEERLHFALESCHIGAWDIELVGNTAYRSLEHDRIFGYADLLPEWTLDMFLQHALPEHRAEVEAMVREATAAQTGWTHECRIRRTDGEIRWIWFSGRYTTDISGRPRVAGVVQDITERKQAEIALCEREEDLNEAQRLAHLGSWHWDAKTDVTTGSHELLRIYGFDPATQTMPNFKEQRGRCYPEEDWEQVNAAVQRTLEIGAGYELDVRVIRDGAAIWVTTRGEATRDVNGQMLCLHGTVQDISERKSSEEALRLTQESIDCAAEMVAWFTPDGRVHYVNDATCRTLGYSRDELLQMTALDFSPGFTWEQYREHWQEVRERKSFSLETTHCRKDGSEYPAEVLVNYLLYGGKEYIFAYGRNITERKQAEEQIKASLAEKEVMLKEIHHRVKNNLQVISSLISLQANDSKDGAVRQVLQDVTYRVRSMALVHEKLYQSADLSHIDFAEYIQGLLSYLWRAHGEIAAGVRMTFDLEPVLLPTDTAVTCGLILNELAVNALVHAFPDSADGEVTVSLQSGADGRTRLCVTDNGVGLPRDLDWRESGSLGLRLVKMLSKQLNSTVEFSSEYGTKFEIIFEIPEA